MATELITVRNTLNGELARVSPALLDNPHLAKVLVFVPDDAKPMKLAAPTTAEEFVARRTAPKPSKPENLTPEDITETEEG